MVAKRSVFSEAWVTFQPGSGRGRASSVFLNRHHQPGLRALQAVTGRLVGFAHD